MQTDNSGRAKIIEAPQAPSSRTPFPSLVAASDLCDKPPETPAVLIEGALYRGGTMLMAGPSKAAKTWTMMDLALSVASGGRWLGFKTTQAPVIYCNFELPSFVVARRLHELCSHRGIKPPSNLHLWNLRGCSVEIADLERELPGKIEALKAGLFVIDPHYKVSAVSGFEENSNDGQGELLARMEAIATRGKAALVIAHHFAKGTASEKSAIDRASGGGVFARWPDAFLSMTPHEEDDCMTMAFVLRAFAPVPDRVARWHFPVWEIDASLDPKKLKKSVGRTETYSADEVMGKLQDGASNAEWHKSTGLSDGTFRRKRDELMQAKKVRCTSGLYYRE
ncbi:MAG: AAA family ATPase [Opitutaceae bacterium]